MTHLSNICHTFAPDIIIIMIEKMMRKILFLATMLVASFGISSVANAKINDKQVDYENRNEIAISYGVYSNSQVISFYEDIIAIMVTGSRGYFDHEKFIGPIGAEYFYHVNKGLGVGGIGIYATQGKDIMSDLSDWDSKMQILREQASLRCSRISMRSRTRWRRPCLS